MTGAPPSGPAAAVAEDAVALFEPTNLMTNLLEVHVHCVHKGAVACRANAADPEDVCTLLVEAPAGSEGGGPACGVVQGSKYMLLLANSSTSAAGAEAAGSCDGRYGTM
jgi:hypothetical protein